MNTLFNNNIQPRGLSPFSFWSQGTNLQELTTEPRLVASSSWILGVVYLRT